MAISKVVYKSSANATPVTWMDVTQDTVAAGNLETNYTAHDASGVQITGTLSPGGGGGGGGLVYETGTWTPAEDINDTTILYTNTHTTLPFFVMMVDDTKTLADTDTNLHFNITNWHSFPANGYIMPLATSYRYGRQDYTYKTSSATTTGINITDSTTPSSSSSLDYWLSTTGFHAYPSSNRYWRAGRTYKWIAVWAPTT